VSKFFSGMALGLVVGLMMSRTEIGQLFTDLIFTLVDALVELLQGASEEGQHES